MYADNEEYAPLALGLLGQSLSLAGLARKHQVCVTTLYNEIADGNLKTTKIRRRRIVTPTQEAEWLRKCGEVA